MYHPHSDEMVQLAMGMMGFFVVHPRDPAFRRVDRDFVFLMNSHSVEPGNYVPKVSEMTNFNIHGTHAFFLGSILWWPPRETRSAFAWVISA